MSDGDTISPGLLSPPLQWADWENRFLLSFNLVDLDRKLQN